ncbi:MAG: hypothetical protein HXX20_15940 [Chloroflexi bacterium]|nr:hypothetical protein [Chloroflexota bacterium]
MASELLPDNYLEFLAKLKEHIRTAQAKAALAVNRELVMLYWHIGHEIWKRQLEQGWGAKVIEEAKKHWLKAATSKKC